MKLAYALLVLGTCKELDKLHGSIEEGLYYIDVSLGSRFQPLSLIFDTGSSRIVFPCSGCKECGTHMNNYYVHSRSRSFVNLNEPFKEKYAEGSLVEGFLANDMMYTQSSAQLVTVGCIQKETNIIKLQEPDGILGMLEFEQYSFCLGNSSGFLSFEALYYDERTEIEMLQDKYLALDLTEIQIDNDSFEIDDFTTERYTLIDTGTTFVYLSSTFFDSFYETFKKNCEHCAKIEVSLQDQNYCFQENKQFGFESFPLVLMKLRDKIVKWEPENYFFKHSRGIYCIGVYLNNDYYNILGAQFLLNRLVTVEDRMISYTDIRCEDLVEDIHYRGTRSIIQFLIILIVLVAIFLILKKYNKNTKIK